MTTIPMQGASKHYTVGDVFFIQNKYYRITHITGSYMSIRPCLSRKEKIVLFFFSLTCLFFVLHVLWMKLQ